MGYFGYSDFHVEFVKLRLIGYPGKASIFRERQFINIKFSTLFSEYPLF